MSRKLVIRLILLVSLGMLNLPPSGVGSALFAAESPGRKFFKPEEIARIAATVLPKGGYTLRIKWGDLGPKLAALGVIDLAKLKRLYGNNAKPPADFRYLEAPSDDFIRITTDNAPLLVNVFWALGLANKNPLLEKLAMERPQHELMRLASTGGWNLGAKPPTEYYSNFDIIRLTPEQQKLVEHLARSIYRPCCDNATSFPDCNHGIALLGLMQLMAANGFGADEILRAALQFNAFWFPEQYVKTALVFHLRGIDWANVNPREVLGFRYSSASGWRENVNVKLQKEGHLVPGQKGGSSC